MRLRRLSRGNQLIEFVLIVAIALGLAFAIQAFVVKPYRIPSASMEPTLKPGQRVLVDRIGNDLFSPSIGDIVVFHPPQGADDEVCGVSHAPTQPCPRAEHVESSTNYIKRVVAVGGDRVSIRDGYVVLNGRLQRHHYLNVGDCSASCNYPDAITVPAGDYFMMGDNRGESDDSRFWGPVPAAWIIGEAFFTYWPPDRIGPL